MQILWSLTAIASLLAVVFIVTQDDCGDDAAALHPRNVGRDRQDRRATYLVGVPPRRGGDEGGDGGGTM